LRTSAPHCSLWCGLVRLDYLERTGEIADAAETSRFLLKSVDEMVLKGERRTLMLANRAIDAYRYRKLRIAS
jgi:hypothetical protein